MSSDPGHDASLSDSPDIIVADTNGLSEDFTIDEKDIKALTLAISGITEGIVRKVVEAKLESLVQPLVEQSVKNLLAESLPQQVAAELPKLAEEQIAALLPGLVQTALAGQQALLKESIAEVARQDLPGLIDPIIERLAKDHLESEVQQLLKTSGPAMIEKIAWEVVPSQAEIEVKKEIDRLSADA